MGLPDTVAAAPDGPPAEAPAARAVFGRADRVALGWYWALPSSDLRRGQARAVTLLGRDLVLWRGKDGRVAALDAYCPHMGAHLAEGKVEEGGLRCFFHHWKFGPDGTCLDVPVMDRPVGARVRSWPVRERYGLVWVWPGDPAEGDGPAALPFVPELGDDPDAVHTALANRFEKRCHPSVMMINAIDAQHFNSVHSVYAVLNMEPRPLDGHERHAIEFSNTNPVGRKTWFGRFVGRFYSDALTYSLCYWYGTAGTVTLGPDFLHFYILFATRLVEDGQSEGRTILVTRRRRGPLGWALNRVLLLATRLVGAYFAKGDTKVFQTIHFDLKTPIAADHAILEFARHVDRQPAIAWGTWEPVGA